MVVVAIGVPWDEARASDGLERQRKRYGGGINRPEGEARSRKARAGKSCNLVRACGASRRRCFGDALLKLKV
jgi:hypothetical protein